MSSHNQFTNIIAISDLHLSASRFQVNDTSTIVDGFADDEAFSKFTQHLVASAKEAGGIWRFLILGDGLDFLHTKIGYDKHRFCHISNFEVNRIKLELIFDAHHHFFSSLGFLLTNGFYVDIIPGNHDIELILTESQDHFKSLMQRHTEKNIVAQNLNFSNWVYHIPGILYAEHGNQYHDINSFVTLLAPMKSSQTGDISHPIGSYFDLYLSYLSEYTTKYQKNTHNLLLHSNNKTRKHPAVYLRQLRGHLYFFWQVAKFLICRSGPWMSTKRHKYRLDKFTPTYSKQVHFPPSILEALDDIAAVHSTRLLSRTIRKLILRNRTTKNEFYLESAAKKIHSVLKQQGYQVPFYLFGHSHVPAKLPLDEYSFYLNTGTWCLNKTPENVSNESLYPYIHIRWSKQSQPEGEILQWDAKH